MAKRNKPSSLNYPPLERSSTAVHISFTICIFEFSRLYAIALSV